MLTEILERRAAITGVGLAMAGRRAGRSALNLTLDAIFEALGDAGLRDSDIDGLSSWPGISSTPGMAPVTLREVKESLGLKLDWFAASPEAPGAVERSDERRHGGRVRPGSTRAVFSHTQSILGAAAAPLRGRFRIAPERVEGLMSWIRPFNGLSAAHPLALVAKRHMHEYGTTREQLGALVLNSRRERGFE